MLGSNNKFLKSAVLVLRRNYSTKSGCSFNNPNRAEQVGRFVLEDGTVFEGLSFGANVSAPGEAVFTTSIVGYPESMTDPSYNGQILVFTSPMIGNYGVPSDALDEYGLKKYFESDKVQVAGIIVQDYAHEYSHWEATRSLSQWLKENNIPALYTIDTRAVTKKLRNERTMMSKIVVDGAADVDFVDINKEHLVKNVSTKKVLEYGVRKGDKNQKKIVAIDCGIKTNIIRNLAGRGAAVKVVPFDYDFTNEEYDGLFISNGPGDPHMCQETISNVRKALDIGKPIFGICLGNQILAEAAGAKTYKLPFGNRGHNQPAIDQLTGRCYITSQNHGFAIDNKSLPADWAPYFINANDGSNEGIYHKSKPFFSTQFHPEARGGPYDTLFMFDKFMGTMEDFKNKKPTHFVVNKQPNKRVNVKKVLVIGSGGLSIGQAGEFDYSGSQAIKSLKEEGIQTVLVNPNIATIQTAKGIADKVYYTPITAEYVEKIIEQEKPDGIFLSFGGQTALNCGVDLYKSGVLKKHGVAVLGTPVQSIIDTEDRDIFNQKMKEINEKVCVGEAFDTVEAGLEYAKQIKFPVMIRAAFALGGLGSGIAANEAEFKEIAEKALASSPQILVERSVKGWKEVEYEVVRDAYDNCITVCNMENFDPCGFHTGESIVVAPSQTLNNEEYQMLRTTAINVIRHLGIIGECNIQYALNPVSREYVIIEVNARLSRSSALASKATGYPLAFIAAKLGLGIPLTEVMNSITKKTTACFEPSLDYCVIKMPRWDMKKFKRVTPKIGSAMKSVGEVMAIGRNFEETIQKAIRMVDTSNSGFDDCDELSREEVEEEMKKPTDRRIFALAAAIQKYGYSVEEINKITSIDKWFLYKLKNISDTKAKLMSSNLENLSYNLLLQSKKEGFSDKQIANYMQVSASNGKNAEIQVREKRQSLGIAPVVKQIDSLAAEYPAQTNYLYMTYNATKHDITFNDKGVMLLGSGVYRIGSSVEFDYCGVMAIRQLRKLGIKTIMLNYNPETVSTDYDESDRLYFEELSMERVLDIYQAEHSSGCIVSFGGQIPNNLALPLHKNGVNILGTSPLDIDRAEDRDKFSSLMTKLGIDQPEWSALSNTEEALKFAEKVEYPVLIRPSYVLSGAAMNVAYNAEQLKDYLQRATTVSPDHPVVVTKFIENAREVEIDGVGNKGEIVCHAVSEHIENAGVHSGDATIVLPPYSLTKDNVDKVRLLASKIVKELNITGPFNMQFLVKGDIVKIIETNLRASRSMPFVAKTLNTDFIEIATNSMMGLSHNEFPITSQQSINHTCIKSPVFSYKRLQDADPILGVEMGSTGEVACFGRNVNEAFVKSLLSSNFRLNQKSKAVLITTAPEHNQERLHQVARSVNSLLEMNYTVYATPEVQRLVEPLLNKKGQLIITDVPSIPQRLSGNGLVKASEIHSTEEKSKTLELISKKGLSYVVNVPPTGDTEKNQEHYLIRRKATNFDVGLFNNYELFGMYVDSLKKNPNIHVESFDKYHPSL